MPIDVSRADPDQVRAALLSRRVDLRTRSAFALALVRCEDGDRLMLNLHHAAGDGKSAMRLMASIARAYSETPDPTPDLELTAARSLRTHGGAQTTREGLTSIRKLAQRGTEGLADPRARVALDGGDDQAGYGFHLLAFDAEESAAIMAARGEATVNDLLVAALVRTIGQFNASHEMASQRVSVMMPVNLRPAQWSDDVVSNVVSFVSVSVPAARQPDLGTILRAVSDRTRAIKAEREAGLLIDMLAVRSQLFVAFKDLFAGLLRNTVESVFDTAVLSNLGRLATTPDFGDAGCADELWFSPPATTSMGPAIGAATLDGRIHLVLRYSRSQFDAAGAARFADVLKDTLTTVGVAGRRASRDAALAR